MRISEVAPASSRHVRGLLFRMPPGWRRYHSILCLISFLLCSTAACRQDMHDQPRYEPLEESAIFADNRSSRELPEGTIARGQLKEDSHLYMGKMAGQAATTFPMELTEDLLARGRQRYDIFCVPCHDKTGQADGMVVRRGFRKPAAFRIERLRDAPPGYFFDVITNGFGSMPGYAEQIPVNDRWAIIAYIRALQLSQHATLEDVPEQERKQLLSERGQQ